MKILFAASRSCAAKRGASAVSAFTVLFAASCGESGDRRSVAESGVHESGAGGAHESPRGFEANARESMRETAPPAGFSPFDRVSGRDARISVWIVPGGTKRVFQVDGRSLAAFPISFSVGESRAKIVEHALEKYADYPLDEFIRTIVVAERLELDGERVARVNSASDRTAYIHTDYPDPRSDTCFEWDLHAAICDALLRRDSDWRWDAWKDTNPSDFRYEPQRIATDPSGHLDERLYHRGFLCNASLTSRESDFTIVAAHLFSGTSEFWHAVDVSPRLRQKLELVVRHFSKGAPTLDADYFRRLAH